MEKADDIELLVEDGMLVARLKSSDSEGASFFCGQSSISLEDLKKCLDDPDSFEIKNGLLTERTCLVPCPACFGSGKRKKNVYKTVCPNCHGYGEVEVPYGSSGV